MNEEETVLIVNEYLNVSKFCCGELADRYFAFETSLTHNYEEGAVRLELLCAFGEALPFPRFYKCPYCGAFIVPTKELEIAIMREYGLLRYRVYKGEHVE